MRATSTFRCDVGIETSECSALLALRSLVSMSATGSDCDIVLLPTSSTWSRRGLLPHARAHANRYGRDRTCGSIRAAVHSVCNDCMHARRTSAGGSPSRSSTSLPYLTAPSLALAERHAQL